VIKLNNPVRNTISFGIIIATPMEAEPFIKCLGMKDTGAQPFPVYMGKDSAIIISGIGKTNAALATAYACMKHDPACILNLGSAGAVRDSEETGRIFNIEKTVEPDRIHIRTNTPFTQYPDILEGFDKAVLSTQDKAVDDHEAFREISAFADLVDMEGASVVQASKRFHKKCLLFKFVSDTPAHAGRGNIILDNIKRLRWPFGDFIIDSVIPIISNSIP